MSWATLFRSSRDRSFRSAFLLWIPLALVSLWLYRDLYTGPTQPSEADHAVRTFNVSVNARFCDAPNTLSFRYSPKRFLAVHRELWSQPIEAALAAEAGSKGAYCKTVTDHVIVNDNSIGWLMRFFLAVRPEISHDALAQSLGGASVVMILVFGFALLSSGASFAFSLACALLGCGILRGVGNRDQIYPFVLSLPLFSAGLWTIVYSSGFARRAQWIALSAIALLMGVLTGFSTIMRPILLPSTTTMMVVVAIAVIVRARPSRQLALKIAAGMGTAFVVGFLVYTRVFVTPQLAPKDVVGTTYVYHTFAHPLVLGLAVPENDLSRREGIAWLDDVGGVLAKRADPTAQFMGARYESALLKYYAGLWRKYPGQMLGVYWLKLRTTGDEVFLSASRIGAQFDLPKAPWEFLHRVTNGVAIVAFTLAVLAYSLRRLLVSAEARMMVFTLVALTVSWSLLEGFLTASIFVANNFSPLLFFVWASVLAGAQATVDTGWTAWERRAVESREPVDVRVVEGVCVVLLLAVVTWASGVAAALLVAIAYVLCRAAMRPSIAIAMACAFAVLATPAILLPPGADWLDGMFAARVYNLAPAEGRPSLLSLALTFPSDPFTRSYGGVLRAATAPFASPIRVLAPIIVIGALAVAFAYRRRAALLVIVGIGALAILAAFEAVPARYLPLQVITWVALGVLIDQWPPAQTAPFNVRRAATAAAALVLIGVVPVAALRLYQRDRVRDLLRAYASAPKTELDVSTTQPDGAMAIAPPAAGQARVLGVDLNRWQCGDDAKVEFVYDKGQPASDFSRAVAIAGSSATHAVVRLFEPVGATSFRGVKLPKAAGCVASVGWVNSRGPSVYPEATLGPQWERTPMFEQLAVEARLLR